MKTEITNFERKDLFDYYHKRENPFLYVTTKVDITNLYKLGKENGAVYGTIGYYITLALNSVEEFKYRYKNGQIFKYDKINPSYTDINNDKIVGWYACELTDNYKTFIQNYKKQKQDFSNSDIKKYQVDTGDDVVWLSCVPWFNFSGIITPFGKDEIIPQITWDKFIFENDRCYVNMVIMFHHGFIDGYHIGLFLEKLNDYINNLEIN